VDKFRRTAYHFNRRAAYAFAARFNLFYGRWSKTVEYASVALGDNPGDLFRDYVAMSKLPEVENITYAYCNSDYPCNFLIIPQTGTLWGRAYTFNRRYAHNRNKAYETFWQLFPWNGAANGMANAWGSDQNIWYPKLLELFEVTNPTAGIGYPHTVVVPFTVEETLACRAEAYAMMDNLPKATDDLNIFYAAWSPSQSRFTTQRIAEFYAAAKPFVKMESRFEIKPGTQQDYIVRAILAVRRFENVHTGMRWLDVKRHGVTVEHPLMLSQTQVGSIIEIKPYSDLTAIQLPAEVISAGLEANSRMH
jgi:hypothetical protein